MNAGSGPRHLSAALSELMALRGVARVGESAELEAVWRALAGESIAGNTRVLGVKRGVLQVGVSNAPLLSELASFHRESLLRKLQQDHAALRIRGLKFRLKGDMAR